MFPSPSLFSFPYNFPSPAELQRSHITPSPSPPCPCPCPSHLYHSSSLSTCSFPSSSLTHSIYSPWPCLSPFNGPKSCGWSEHAVWYRRCCARRTRMKLVFLSQLLDPLVMAYNTIIIIPLQTSSRSQSIDMLITSILCPCRAAKNDQSNSR